MKTQRFAFVLTGINLVLLLVILAQTGTAAPQAPAPVLRGSALELVDENGQLRARLNVEPEGDVVLRMLDEHGTIRVKLGASEEGSGLVLLNDATEPGVQILAKAAGTSVNLKNREGREHIITP
jgi:hypothetical protein